MLLNSVHDSWFCFSFCNQCFDNRTIAIPNTQMDWLWRVRVQRYTILTMLRNGVESMSQCLVDWRHILH